MFVKRKGYYDSFNTQIDGTDGIQFCLINKISQRFPDSASVDIKNIHNKTKIG